MDRGGVGRYGRLLVEGLRGLPEGPEVAVVERGAKPSWTTACFTPWGRALVRRRARDTGADLLHSLHLELPRVQIPCVVTVHDLIPLEVEGAMPSRARRSVFRRLLESSLRRSARVIVPSEVTRASLERMYGVNEKVVVVPNAVDPVFAPRDEEARVAARRRFAEGNRYVAAMSDDRIHKTPDVLRDAARRIADAGTPVVFAGDVRRAFASLRQVGRLSDDDLAAFLAGADVFLMPSRLEGFGLPLAEAAACGTPGVATEGVGAVSYLGEGVVTARPQASEIADAVLALLGDEEERQRRAGAAISAATALTVRSFALGTSRVYGSLLR